MKRLAPYLALLTLAAARIAEACPLCAGSSTPGGGGAGTSVWTAVGVFLFVPPILGLVVVAAMRRETRKNTRAPERAGVPTGFVRFNDRTS